MSLGSFFGGGDRREPATDDDPFAAFDRARLREPAAPGAPPVPPSGPLRFDPPPPKRRIRWGRWIVRGLGIFIVLLVIAILWLAVTAPLSRSLKPPTPPSVTLLASDGKTPIARRGAIIGAPVDVAKLPKHVPGAFTAIEDRRFYSHWGISPRGITRAMWNNFRAGGMREGGSTITQQLAKNAFLTSDRTFGRKAREVMIAFWLEAWLSKDEILSRYLSNVYFGDNVYGLSAASQHYFSRRPDQLSVAQAAMLAGLVKAPSRLAPTLNLAGARARQKLVVGAMVETGVLTKAEAADVGPARLNVERIRDLPTGTYFADWVLPQARDREGEIANEITVTTTLDRRMQRAAERAVRRAGLRQAQVALVAMRPDGTVVAMVGGKDYKASPFNRAVQARRQPGSTFKLFVYLAALEAGRKPDDQVTDEPVTIDGWSPRNSSRRFSGAIDLRTAFAYSINTVAAKLGQEVGFGTVADMARRFGITTPVNTHPSMVLGTSDVRLIDMTRAFASISQKGVAVTPYGITRVVANNQVIYQHQVDTSRVLVAPYVAAEMTDLLQTAVNTGSARAAQIGRPTAGKTGTTTLNKDGWFLGFSSGITTGVWMGRDDAKTIPGLQGGTAPARAFAGFMRRAVASRPVEQFDTQVTLPEWQLEPDDESYFGQPDNGSYVDADGNPLPQDDRTDEAPVRDDPDAVPSEQDPNEQLDALIDRVNGRPRDSRDGSRDGEAPPPGRATVPREAPRSPPPRDLRDQDVPRPNQ